MPDNPIAGLYPQPAQPNQGSILSGNPLSLIGPLMQIQQLNANRAVGQAFQSALRPDGTLDTNALTTGLKNPNATLAAPAAIGTGLDITGKSLANTGQGIANTAASTNLNIGRQNDLMDNLSAHADDPDLTPAKIRSIATSWAATTGTPYSFVAPIMNSVLSNKAGIASALQAMRTARAGAAAASSRVQGPPDASGAPTTTSMGHANAAGAAPGAGGSITTALPPGSAEAIASNRTAMVNDTQAAAETMKSVRPLENALPLLEKMTASDFGKTSQGFADIKSALISMHLIGENTTDAEVRQEAEKYLQNYAGLTRGAERSDQGLAQSKMSNPSMSLNGGAVIPLVKNQMGMDKMDAAMPQAYRIQHPEDPQGANYLNWKSNYYQTNDPRAWRWNSMSPDERAQTIQSLGPRGGPAWNKFQNSYNLATQTHMISPPQATSGQ